MKKFIKWFLGLFRKSKTEVKNIPLTHTKSVVIESEKEMKRSDRMPPKVNNRKRTLGRRIQEIDMGGYYRYIRH